MGLKQWDLEGAIQTALDVHRGQVDKQGAPYILHPLRVMLSLESERDKIVGVLHDVLEDTHNHPPALLGRFTLDAEQLDALDSLTRRKEESYESYIERVALSPMAVRVKLKDLEDNMDPARPIPVSLLSRYRAAYLRLGGMLA